MPLRFPSLQQGENLTFFFFLISIFSLFNRTECMGESVRALENSPEVLDQQWELIQGKKKKKSHENTS